MYRVVDQNDNLIYTTEYGDATRSIISPKVKTEMGKAGSFEFLILPNHLQYNNLNKMKTFLTVYKDTEILFKGRVISLETDIYKQKTVYCEGLLSCLNDTIIAPGKYHEKVSAFFARIIGMHNAQVSGDNVLLPGNVTIEEKDKELDFEIGNYQNTMDCLDDFFMNEYGGYFRIRYESNGNYIDYVKDYGSTATQSIEFGKNLLDISRTSSLDDYWTVLIPLGATVQTQEGGQTVNRKLTIASVNQGSVELEVPEGVAEYGRIVHVEDFNDISDASKLLQKAQEFISTNFKSHIDSFDIKALDLNMLDTSYDRIRTGDKVRIKSAPHNLDEEITCISIDFDLQTPSNTTYEFGYLEQGSLHSVSGSNSALGAGSSMSGMYGSSSVEYKKYKSYTEEIVGDIAVSVKIVSDKSIALTSDVIALQASTITLGGRVDDLNAAQIRIQQITEQNSQSIITLQSDVLNIDADVININGRITNLVTGISTADLINTIGLATTRLYLGGTMVQKERITIDGVSHFFLIAD